MLVWVGEKYIWEKNPQNPQAIELMWHASDPRPAADAWGTRHHAVYFGLSVVKPKTPALLAQMARLAMASEDPALLARIAWGCSAEAEALIARFAPFEAAPEPSVAARAQLMTGLLRGKGSAFQWFKARDAARLEPRWSDDVAGHKARFAEWPRDARAAWLASIVNRRDVLAMAAEDLDWAAHLAQDGDAAVRQQVARLLGMRLACEPELRGLAAFDALSQLASDADEGVRYAALYHGLCAAPTARPEWIGLLLAAHREHDHAAWRGPIEDALAYCKDAVPAALEALAGARDGDGAWTPWARTWLGE
ncbi:MAG: hypothetical protein R3F17_04080 [Planctomycetota bacterium]